MKIRNYTLLFLCLLLQNLQAQTFPYTFTVEHDTYVPLTNSISVTDGVWDDIDVTVPLGFNFEVFGQSTSTLTMYGGLTAFNIFGLPSSPTPFLISFGVDLIDKGYESGVSESPISYKTEGVAGSRIFKMEWANAGFYDDTTGTAFTNVQTWVFEGSNNVELHVGPTEVDAASVFIDFSGPLIGFMDSYNLDTDGFDNLWYLEGSVNEPVVSHINQAGIFNLTHTLEGAPGDGIVYRFSTGTVAVQDAGDVKNQVRVFPSVVSNSLTIVVGNELAGQEQGLKYNVLNPLGEVVRTGALTGTDTKADLSALSGGMYFVNVFAPGRVIATEKVWKQ